MAYSYAIGAWDIVDFVRYLGRAKSGTIQPREMANTVSSVRPLTV